MQFSTGGRGTFTRDHANEAGLIPLEVSYTWFISISITFIIPLFLTLCSLSITRLLYIWNSYTYIWNSQSGQSWHLPKEYCLGFLSRFVFKNSHYFSSFLSLLQKPKSYIYIYGNSQSASPLAPSASAGELRSATMRRSPPSATASITKVTVIVLRVRLNIC